MHSRFHVYTIALSTCLALMVALPANARAVPDPYPLRAEVRTMAGQRVEPAVLKQIQDDFATRREAIQKAGGPALAKTDEGYGAKFKARYYLKDGYVDIYSGIMDGWLQEWHVRPMAVAAAIAMAKHVAGTEGGGLKVNWAKPSHQDARSITYTSEGDGCSAGYTFKLDAAGRCVEIDRSGAC